jgi:hypothetical protein
MAGAAALPTVEAGPDGTTDRLVDLPPVGVVASLAVGKAVGVPAPASLPWQLGLLLG